MLIKGAKQKQTPLVYIALYDLLMLKQTNQQNKHHIYCLIRYIDIRIKTMFDSSLPSVVCRRARVLFTLFVFVCLKWCPTHIVWFVFVLCTQCCKFLWIVYSWLPLQFSNLLSYVLKFTALCNALCIYTKQTKNKNNQLWYLLF
jgi:hypothetical protein